MAQSKNDTVAVLSAFITLLRSPSPITLSNRTLLGAITHFFSSLSPTPLKEFILELISSQSLWDTPTISTADVRDAIRLSVSAVVDRINEEKKDVYFSHYRTTAKARSWLAHVLTSVLSSSNDSSRPLHILVGVLEGLDDVQMVDWGHSRVKLEEEVILRLAGCIDKNLDDNLLLFCTAIPHLDAKRAGVLDILSLNAELEKHFYTLIDQSQRDSPNGVDNLAITSRALARSFVILDSGGPSSRGHLWDALSRFCLTIRDIGGQLEKQLSEQTVDATPTLEHHKSVFSSFLLPASAIIDILVARVTSSENESPAVDRAVELLLALASFAYLTDDSKGSFENYHRILFGSLDIVSGKGGVQAAERLFALLGQEDPLSDGRAAFLLLLGDELVHQLGRRSIDILLPLAEEHSYRYQHRPSFEAAHTFFLSLLRASAATFGTSASQSDFFDILLPNYLTILIKQINSGNISDNQFKDAYPMITSYAALRGPSSVSLCRLYMSRLSPSRASRQVAIRLAPYIPTCDLPAYLDSISTAIQETPRGSEDRLILMEEAFKMVTQDLRDEHRRLGMEWWLQWKAKLDDKEGKMGFWKARL
ncbi:expressed protein [Cryptococcus deneoformans JEC21]|uniref:Expressed protein n=1 Tax=Cryptococcus deneoformans (strain JEC21 / ATCC MYA-565) TaxID=214684 RepID=Q5KH17_CRYD1|nr:expressed protein [Cryptococcus neoformans var. neoformans JEC21]AAW43468.2 expressed protein [Cryptococcus neoformans var. neoformans JEC21]